MLVPVSIFAVWTTFGKAKAGKGQRLLRSLRRRRPTREPAPPQPRSVRTGNKHHRPQPCGRQRKSLLAPAFPWAMTLEYENEHFPIPDQLEHLRSTGFWKKSTVLPPQVRGASPSTLSPSASRLRRRRARSRIGLTAPRGLPTGVLRPGNREIPVLQRGKRPGLNQDALAESNRSRR